MTMVLVLCGISLVLTALTAVALSVLVRAADASEQKLLTAARHVGAPKFFEKSAQGPFPVAPAAVPLELLLLRIDQHVRLEQAAAESFHQFPTVESLHRQTASPLMH
jgi:hypothetical protein